MHSLPEDSDSWKRRADWIAAGFCAPTKTAKEALADILQFVNGDTTCDTITHWCLPGCCRSDGESINKLLKLLIPFFGKGYSTPLLYRFKHYGPASSFIKVGCTLCKVLPNALAQMSDSCKNTNSEMAAMLDVLLADNSSFKDEDLQRVVGDILDADVDYAAKNSLRKKMMITEVCSARFPQHAVLMDIFLQPMEIAMNSLLGRTKILHELYALGSQHPKHDSLLQTSRSKFLLVLSGQFGQSIMAQYESILQGKLFEAMGMGLQLEQDSSRLRLVYELVIVSITDTWRRFVHEVSAPPYSCFDLVGTTIDEFLDKWDSLQFKRLQCIQCLDDTFTGVLLSEFPEDLRQKPVAVQESTKKQLETLLLDIAGWAPLTSDLVEIKNGAVQWSVSRRGNTQLKSQKTGVEVSLLQSCIKKFQLLKHVVDIEALPARSKSSGILKMVGTSSSNQFSKVTEKAPLSTEWAGVGPFFVDILRATCFNKMGQLKVVVRIFIANNCSIYSILCSSTSIVS